MTTLEEIEAVLPALSAEELACVESMLRRLRRERGEPNGGDLPDRFCDGRPWPETAAELRALLAEMEATPPLEMTNEEIAGWEARRQLERERQKRAFPEWAKGLGGSFS